MKSSVTSVQSCVGFTAGFRLKSDKLKRRWSLGYWEGVDPGLALVGKPGEKALENTRFCAVIAYGPDDMAKIVKHVDVKA